MRPELDLGDACMALRACSFTVRAQKVLTQRVAQMVLELGVHSVGFQRSKISEFELPSAHTAVVHSLGCEHCCLRVRAGPFE
jgi:hypothetical protein